MGSQRLLRCLLASALLTGCPAAPSIVNITFQPEPVNPTAGADPLRVEWGLAIEPGAESVGDFMGMAPLGELEFRVVGGAGRRARITRVQPHMLPFYSLVPATFQEANNLNVGTYIERCVLTDAEGTEVLLGEDPSFDGGVPLLGALELTIPPDAEEATFRFPFACDFAVVATELEQDIWFVPYVAEPEQIEAYEVILPWTGLLRETVSGGSGVNNGELPSPDFVISYPAPQGVPELHFALGADTPSGDQPAPGTDQTVLTFSVTAEFSDVYLESVDLGLTLSDNAATGWNTCDPFAAFGRVEVTEVSEPDVALGGNVTFLTEIGAPCVTKNNDEVVGGFEVVDIDSRILVGETAYFEVTIDTEFVRNAVNYSLSAVADDYIRVNLEAAGSRSHMGGVTVQYGLPIIGELLTW